MVTCARILKTCTNNSRAVLQDLAAMFDYLHHAVRDEKEEPTTVGEDQGELSTIYRIVIAKYIPITRHMRSSLVSLAKLVGHNRTPQIRPSTFFNNNSAFEWLIRENLACLLLIRVGERQK